MIKSIFRGAIFTIFTCLIIACSEENDYSDTREVASSFMLDSFLKLTKCLSIKSTSDEKLLMIRASKILIKTKELGDEYSKQQDEDFDFIIKLANQKCPHSLKKADYAIDTRTLDSKNELRYMLYDIVVTNISNEILSKEEKEKIFSIENISVGNKTQNLEIIY